MPDLTPLAFTVPLIMLSTPIIIRKIACLMGSMDSRDPNSTTSRRIDAYQNELSNRGKPQVGRNNAPFSGNTSRRARDDR